MVVTSGIRRFLQGLTLWLTPWERARLWLLFSPMPLSIFKGRVSGAFAAFVRKVGHVS